jgi:predicted dehydrogenase
VRVLDGTRETVVHLEDGSSALAETVRPLRSGTVPTGGVADATRYTALLLEDWLPALRGGTGTAPTIAAATAVQAVIDAARRSATGGGWVQLANYSGLETT